MWGKHSVPFDGKGQMVLSATMADPVAGAFLAPLEKGWLLVVGRGTYSAVRHTFFDESPEAATNAESIQALGVPVISLEEGQDRVREGGGIVILSLAMKSGRQRQPPAMKRYGIRICAYRQLLAHQTPPMLHSSTMVTDQPAPAN